MHLLETQIDISPLQRYARSVIQHGGIKEVYLVGSAVYSPTPNDIDILYVISANAADEHSVVDYIENNTNIDLDSYDSFFKFGDRYFYCASGAGRSIVENTKYALEQIHKGVLKLA